MLADKLKAASLSKPPIEEVGSVTATGTGSVTFAAPSGTMVGDLMVAVVTSNDNNLLSSTTFALQAGFGSGGGAGSTGDDCPWVFSREVTESEPANYTIVYGNGSDNKTLGVTVTTFRNAILATVGAYASADKGSSTSVAPQIYILEDSWLLDAVGSKSKISPAPTAPTGMSFVSATNTDNFPFAGLYKQESISKGLTGTRTVSSSSSLNSVLIGLSNTGLSGGTSPYVIGVQTNKLTSSGTSLTINKPAGTQNGHLMVAVCGGGFSFSNNYSFPSGWTEIAERGSRGGPGIAVKIATASEPSSYTINTTNNSLHAGTIVTFANSAYDTVGTFATDASTIVAPGINVSEADSILLALFFSNSSSGNWTIPSGMVGVAIDNDGDSPSYLLAYQQIGAGASGTRSSSCGASDAVAGILLSIKPS